MDIKGKTIFEFLYAAIQNGEFKSGEMLTEREIARKFNVSRTPVREALRRLEKFGLVQFEPHKGVKVISVSRERVIQLYQVREVLEGLGARLIVQKESTPSIERLEQLLQEAEQAISADDIEKLTEINTTFHALLAESSGNEYLMQIMKTLQSHIRLVMSTSLNMTGRPLENIKEHQLIVDAIRSGDPELAECVTKFHVRNAMENALKMLGKTDEND